MKKLILNCLFLFVSSCRSLTMKTMDFPCGIQSGRDDDKRVGNSFAGSMTYDADTNSVLVTGATYSSFFEEVDNLKNDSNSKCFLSIISLTSSPEQNPDFLSKTTFGTTSSEASCSSLTKLDSNKIYVGGFSEEGGPLTSMRPIGSIASKQYGIVLDVDVDLRIEQNPTSISSTTTTLLGGRLLHYAPIQSIVALVLTKLGDTIFVVSQQSEQVQMSPQFDVSSEQPNLIEHTKWGTNFYINVMMLKRRQGLVENGLNDMTTFESPFWNTDIAVQRNSVDVAGLAHFSQSSILVVAGSSDGSNGQIIPQSISDQWNGYVTLLNSASGSWINSTRIETQVGKLTRVEGICHHPDSEDEIYIVGSTNGRFNKDIEDEDSGNMTAFLLRVTVPGLTLDWARQLRAKVGPKTTGRAEMLGMACAVTDDGVYIGGVMKRGSVIDDLTQKSTGKDDIWISYLSTDTKKILWTRQIGSPEDEHLSSLMVDSDGNVLVLGNTKGSFMRHKAQDDLTSDIFLLRLTKLTGEYPLPVSENSVPSNTPLNSSGKPEILIPHDDGRGINLLIAFIVICSLAILVACFINYRRPKSKNLEITLSEVEEYMYGIDDEVEIDLQRSSTGGVHGIYVNHDGAPRPYPNRFLGEDECITFSSPGEMSNLTHATIIKDSLFSLDDDDHDLYGGGALGHHRPALPSKHTSYRGLVDVYNNYDLSHHRLPASRPQPLVEVKIDDDDSQPISRSWWGREII
jgi:hypothetical protein